MNMCDMRLPFSSFNDFITVLTALNLWLKSRFIITTKTAVQDTHKRQFRNRQTEVQQNHRTCLHWKPSRHVRRGSAAEVPAAAVVQCVPVLAWWSVHSSHDRAVETQLAGKKKMYQTGADG